MTKNLGTIDRVVRIALAVIVAVLIISGALNGALAIILGVLAAVFLLTGLVGFCPRYMAFHFSTAKKL